MSAELVETSRLFARTNAAIDPAWAEQLAGHLAKRSYSEPHWETPAGFGGRRREGHPVRRADRREAAHPARARRPAARARALHPARPRRRGLGHDPTRQAALRVRAREPRPAPRTRRGRGAHPPARHPRRRRGGLRVLRGASAGGCLGHALVRTLVARRAPHDPRAAHDAGDRPRRRRRRDGEGRRVPRPLAAGRPDPLAALPVRAGRRRRRRDRAGAARAAPPARARRVRLAGAGPARRAHHRDAAHAAEGAAPQGRARRRMGGEDLGRAARRARARCRRASRSPRRSGRRSGGSPSPRSTRATSTSSACRRTCA